MSGSQHNPNGRQSQLGSGWSPLQLQMANLLARAPQAHMASERGVTWHTPTPPPHLYHVPAPSPPDPLQAMKTAGSNSVFRHTATPPELYRHTPTPPDKHLIRHTPSPGDVKAASALPQVDIYPHLGPARDKVVRAEELVGYGRVGVDLSLGGRANGASPHLPPSPALSVRDAPTINSLIARAAPRRVDSLLERLAPAPASPHSVIVHSRLQPTPSPPSSNEDSADSCGAPPGSKRKRKPERVVRVPVLPPARENGAPSPSPDTTRRKTRSGSAETIADIAAMIAEGGEADPPAAAAPPPPLSVDKLASVLAPDPPPPPAPPAPAEPVPPAPVVPAPPPRAPSPAPAPPAPLSVPPTVAPAPAPAPPAAPAPAPAPTVSPTPTANVDIDADKDKDRTIPETANTVEAAAAPRRRSARTSNSEATNVPVESPSEAKPAEPEGGPPTAQPAAASFVEVENQLEKMFAGLEEEPRAESASESASARPAPPKRRKSAPARGRRHARQPRARRPALDAEPAPPPAPPAPPRARGPYIQIRGPRESPACVTVMNAGAGEEEDSGRRRGEERRRGMHASTLGLRYDAATRDATWLCAFCARPPHHDALGDLFGPYSGDNHPELWLHADCGVWASGVVASGARLWGLAECVESAARARCSHCGRAGAATACSRRACAHRAHLPCARAHSWHLSEEDFRALCPQHAPAPAPTPAPAPAPAPAP